MTGVGAHAQIIDVFSRFQGSAGLAFHHESGDLTYRALSAAAAALADRLTGESSADRGPVLIYGHRDRRFLIAYWACLLAGRTCVPIEPDLTTARIAAIAELTETRLVLLAENPEPGRLPADGPPAMAVSLDACGRRGPTIPRPATADADTAYILFSSGTTGAPKGIEISYANLADFVCWMRTLTDELGEIGCVSGNVRYCFDVSLFELWLAWVNRTPISALDHRDIWNIGKYIRRFGTHDLTTWVSTPALATHYLKHKTFGRAALPKLKTMLFCGEILSKNLVMELIARFPGIRIINTYGPTECTVAVTSVEITAERLAADGPLPIGRPRAGTSLSVQPSGARRGEIIISGRSVGKGYLGANADQDARFCDPASYRTGDWGWPDAAGLWHFAGRQDREVKIEGHRIDLNTVEAVIRGCAGVSEVVVGASEPGARSRGLRAYIVGPCTEDELHTLARIVADMLAPHMIPRFWYGHGSYVLNANSKLDRDRLQADLTQNGIRYVFSPQAPADRRLIAAQ